MDVRLSAEQRALRDSVVQLTDRLGPSSVADLTDRERSAKLDAAVAATGWRELRAGDDDGNPWASAVEAAIVAEELGRGLADTAFIGPTLAAELRRLTGTPSATGLETVALIGDLAAPAVAAGGEVPAATVVFDAAGSQRAIVLLPAAAGWQLGEFAVALVEDGGLDLTRPTGRSAAVAATPIAGQTRELTEDDLTRWTALGLALSCADLVGVMRGTIALATNYAGLRQQYGALIGSFQAVQHLLADAFVAMEGSRSVALHAAWAVDALPPDDALAAAATAKAYCARSARAVCETSIQVHGGIGNTWECLAHVYLRRGLISGDLLGGVGPSLDRVLDRVLDNPRIGAGDGLR